MSPLSETLKGIKELYKRANRSRLDREPEVRINFGNSNAPFLRSQLEILKDVGSATIKQTTIMCIMALEEFQAEKRRTNKYTIQ